MLRPSSAVNGAFAVLLLMLCAAAASAQTLRGRVVDAATRQPVGDVRVTLSRVDGTRVAEFKTDPTGLFIFTSRESGEYRLSASHIAYEIANSAPLFVGVAEEAVVELQLATAPIPLDPLTVVARRSDARNEATYDGLYARFRMYPPIGNRRVLLPHDPEMGYSRDMRDILEWIAPFRRRAVCSVVYWNGNLQQSPEIAAFRLETPVSMLEGVEFYRSMSDAPLAYRDIPSYLQECTNFQVLALWARTGEYLDQTVARYYPEPAPWYPRASLVGYRVNGAHAPRTGIGLEITSHQGLTDVLQLGVLVRVTAHELSAGASAALTSTLSDLTYELPPGDRGFQLWVLGADAKVIPIRTPRLRVATSARIQLAQRRFSLVSPSIGAGDIGVTSYGWGYGITASAEFQLGRHLNGSFGVGQDWFRFRKYEELERSYNPTAADWSATAIRFGLSYNFARD
jgi:hypothetical protein